eukprot:gene47688-62040_t
MSLVNPVEGTTPGATGFGIGAGATPLVSPRHSRQSAAMKALLPLLLLLTAASDPAPPLLSPERIKADVRTLSADDFHGRGPTQQGEPITLAFLERRFAQLGLKPLGDAGYRQTVPLLRWTREQAHFALDLGGKTQVLTPGVEIAATSRIIGTSGLDHAGV